MLFYGKIIAPFFYVRNAGISKVYTKYKKKLTFQEKATSSMLYYQKILTLFARFV